MKAGIVVSCILIVKVLAGYHVCAQQSPLASRQEQALEELAAEEEAAIEDDSFVEQMELFKKHPINLNTASADELQLLQVLTSIQVKAFLQYRALLGNLVHLYELQAVPYWDVGTIQKILPYITISHPPLRGSRLFRLQEGTGTMLIRLAQTLGAASARDTGARQHLGSSQKLLVRYRYNYKNLVQFGLLGDKDAGEPLFREKQRLGFDFYSFHLFIRKLGIVHSLAIGDFSVNMGQGLIQWQSLSFRKSSEVTTSKRQSAVLRPYGSSGEYNFHRGVGISLQKKRFLLTAFGSLRRLSANLSEDTANGNLSISSFLTSGLHRTADEQAERNNIRQRVAGGSISYDHSAGHVSGNIVHYDFSHPINKRDEPYNLFSFRGRRLLNYSIDYDHTWRNVHLFGEIAASQQSHIAVIHGLLVSLDRKLGASMVIRHLSPGFQSLHASAFTENTLPSNESGLFMGLSFKPGKGFSLDAYADVFRFPWLKFRTDAPSHGREYLVQLVYRPHKRLEISNRFRFESRQTNSRGDNEPVNTTRFIPRESLRNHITWHPSPAIRLRQRVEFMRFDRGGSIEEEGFLIYYDLTYDPAGRPFGLGGRLQLFETDGFNSRIYAFENDVPSGYSIPAVHQKGVRYYVNITLNINKVSFKRWPVFLPPVSIYMRWAHTLYKIQTGPVFQHVGSPECKLQIIFSGY